MSMDFSIRDAQLNDIDAILEIYSRSVMEETASWEYYPPSKEEMIIRFENISAKYPYLIAHIDNEIIGYAYASLFRGREGWRFACENSVYVKPKYHGLGIAKALMNQLCDKCAQIGLKTMVAVIGDSENQASIALHKSLGFVHVCTFSKIGFKFDRWLDSVIMQKSLA